MDAVARVRSDYEEEPHTSSLLKVYCFVDKEFLRKITEWAMLNFVVPQFDHLGLSAPFTIRMRIQLQKL